MGAIKKTIANILCGVLCVGAVAGAGAALYMGGKNNGWFDKIKNPDFEQSMPDNSGVDKDNEHISSAANAVVCNFNASNGKIATNDFFTVAGKQGTCTPYTVNALNETFSSYLKMETATAITFTTDIATELKVYTDTAEKNIKIDGVNVKTSVTSDGDICAVATLSAGEHSITKGDSMGVFNITLAPLSAGGMQIAPETTASQMRVKSRALAVSEYSNYGVSAQAENACTLTAEVLPDYASDKSLNWSVAWQNPSSSWASGKNVTDYVTITPESDGALTAVCACLQDFGEPVTLTVSSRSNPAISSDITVHYYQRIKSLNYAFSFDGESIDVSADSHGVYKFDYTGEKNYTVDLVPVYSNYTLTDTYTTTINGAFSSTFGYTATMSLKTLAITAGLSGGEAQDSDVNSLRSALTGFLSMAENPQSNNEGYTLGLSQYCSAIVGARNRLQSKGSTHPFYLAVKTVAEKFSYTTGDFHGTPMPLLKTSASADEIRSALSSYKAPAYNYYGASITNYNDFVTAAKKCNSAGVGVIQYTIKIAGTYSTYETVLNLGYNDEFKANVQNVNVSDIIVSF